MIPMGEPSLFPQGRYQAHQVDSQALLTHNHTLQGHLGHPAPLTHRTIPCHNNMLCDLDRDHGNLNDFPGPLHPSPNQVGPTIRTDLHGMLDPLGRHHPRPGETMRPPFAWRLSWLWPG